jgi:hypothetical protein
VQVSAKRVLGDGACRTWWVVGFGMLWWEDRCVRVVAGCVDIRRHTYTVIPNGCSATVKLIATRHKVHAKRKGIHNNRQ